MLTICLALWLAEASAAAIWLLQTVLSINLLWLGVILAVKARAATRSPSAKSIVRYYDDGSIEATYSIE